MIMQDYRALDEKLQYTARMQRVSDAVEPRLLPYGRREGTNTSPVGTEGKNPFLDVFEEMPDAPLVIAQAHAIVRSWMVTPCVIYPDEAVVGITRPFYPIREHFHWGVMTDEFRRDVVDPMPDSPEKERLLNILRRMSPLSFDEVLAEGRRQIGPERMKAIQDDCFFSPGGYQGHTVPNYPRLLEKGLDGMLDYIDACAAQHPEAAAADMYEACRVIVRGMSRWLQNYADLAADLCAKEENPVQKGYYAAIAENCAFVAHKRPETLYQAVQLMWCLSLWDWVDCIGRMDQYFWPFFEKAVREGDVISPEESIVSIMLKIRENGAHNVTIGGVDERGRDAANDLTYLMLQILRRFHDTYPRVSVRVHRNSPPQLLRLCVQLWSEGMSDPTMVSDEVVVPGLTHLEVPLEHARDYTILGCQEIEIPGRSNTGCEDGVINISKILEYTLYNGRSTSHPDVRAGLETGEFADFRTFDDFYAAFEKQLKFFTRLFIDMCNRGQELRAANFAKVVKTPFTEGCLEKGVPHDAGGPLYNYGVIETGGVAVVSDSLLAIRKLVFEQRKISRQRLIDALRANFEGYEPERQLLLHSAPKFGNDDPEADEMMVRVLNLFWDEIGRYRSVRGGLFTGACSLLTAGIHYGQHMGAMPDGRFAGEPIGNTMGPRPGADRSGLTAMLNSVAKLPLNKGLGGTTLNVVLTQRMLSTQEKRDKIAAVMRAYLTHGGQMAQITTANLEDLRDAQAHPERHGNLLVRIGGFSVRFLELDKAAQDEVISRYSCEAAE